MPRLQGTWSYPGGQRSILQTTTLGAEKPQGAGEMMNLRQYIITILILFTAVSLFFLDIIVKKNQEINQLAQSMTDYNFIISNQIETILKLETQLSQIQISQTQIVKISFYHPQSRGINSDSDHTKTATMTKPIVGRTVAISDELFDAGWLGSKIYINGFGIFKAEDRMSPNISGKQIDVCVASRKRAMRLGIKHNIVAVKL